MFESSFSDALDEINASLESEKNHGKKLALLSAKSWVLRNKLYASLHDPYIYTLNEIENRGSETGLGWKTPTHIERSGWETRLESKTPTEIENSSAETCQKSETSASWLLATGICRSRARAVHRIR